MQNCDIIQV